MADNPFFSSNPQFPGHPDPLASAGNPAGAPRPLDGPLSEAGERGPPARVHLLDRVRNGALYLGLLLALWGVAYAGLLFVGKMKSCDAIGFATIAALVASFFTRSLVPQLADRSPHQMPSTPQHTDSAREIIETVVFVVVLVLLLKSFTAEAFVIPTGSMAETLLGYQKVVSCPQCKLEFPVNCSSEVDPSDGADPMPVRGCVCPNCRQDIHLIPPQMKGQIQPGAGNIPDPGWRSGDRVLVAKFVYDLLDKEPDRLDVVVFKFPGDRDFPITGPVKRHVPINYIKRLIGLPGETIAIHRGKLWVLPADRNLKYDDVEKAAGNPGKLAQLWKLKYTHHDDPQALERFNQKDQFLIVRKSPENMLAMRRIVYDNDHQALDLDGPAFQRWVPLPDSGWNATDKASFAHDGTNGLGWLRYRHVLRGTPDRPQLITDFMGYNTWASNGGVHQAPRENWATDLMIECAVAVESSEGSFVLELSRGPHRYRATFEVSTGECTLALLEDGKDPQPLQSAKTTMKGKGNYLLRFANIDDRLTVWVDERLPFGHGYAYPSVRNVVPTRENDLERPVSIGSQGARVKVSKVKVYRDTYYTTARSDRPSEPDVPEFKPDDPDTWGAWERAPVSTYYIQPSHYLCLGDNSPESSDGRSWGLVPRRLLLGRAVLVYYPFCRAGRIR